MSKKNLFVEDVDFALEFFVGRNGENRKFVRYKNFVGVCGFILTVEG